MRGRVAAYEGPEPFIFISYCHQDSDRVLPYIEMMSREGYRIWYDEGITPGEEWTENIAKHLEGSSVFIAFITEASLNSHNCRREINFAIQRNKNFISLFLDDVRLSAGMEMLLSSVQGIYRSKYIIAEDFMRKLYSTAVLDQCQDSDHKQMIPIVDDYDEETTVTLTQGAAGFEERILETCLLRVSTLERIHITKSNFTIGRSKAQADYAISGENSISRRHATIRKSRDAYMITDNRSLNHVGINGKLIAPGIEYEMEPFDIISLANEHLVFLRNYNETALQLMPGYELRDNDDMIRISRRPVIRIGSRIPEPTGQGDEIVLRGEGIRDMHAILITTEEGIWLADISGTHSTSVNGRVLLFCQKVRLQPGDIVGLGARSFEVVRRI